MKKEDKRTMTQKALELLILQGYKNRIVVMEAFIKNIKKSKSNQKETLPTKDNN